MQLTIIGYEPPINGVITVQTFERGKIEIPESKFMQWLEDTDRLSYEFYGPENEKCIGAISHGEYWEVGKASVTFVRDDLAEFILYRNGVQEIMGRFDTLVHDLKTAIAAEYEPKDGAYSD